MRYRNFTTYCPDGVRHCIAGVAMPIAPKQRGSAMQELPCPLPPGSEVVYYRSPTAHCPQEVRHRVAEVPLPTAPGQCGGAFRAFHYPLPRGSEVLQEFHCALAPMHGGSVVHESHSPLPPSREAIYCRSSTAQYLQGVRQCVAEVPLPLPPGTEAVHYPLPLAREVVYCRICTAHCLQAVRQRIAGVPHTTAPKQ